MKSNAQFIEALEPRVAPAILVNGGNLLGGNGNPTTGETSTGANTVTLVKVLSGQALVFYNNGVITGISVGKHTKLDITGDVQGDIVTNLDANGRLSDSDNNPINGEDGGVLNGFGIKGITTHPLGTETGSIGRIIAGGAVSNVNIAGQCAGIYAGDGIFRDSAVAKVTTGPVDTNSVLSGTQDTFVFSKTSTVPSNNAAITNVTVHTAQGLEIFAGSGASNASGTGVNGSSISNVTIAKTLAAQGTAPVLYLYAGDGGSGTNGGNGGSISSFNDQGSIAYVKLETGNGGAASNGLGGSGGALTSSTIVSSSTRYDFIMGNGGTGATGGVGGGIKGLTFTNNITGGASLIATDDFNGDGLPDVVLVNTLTGEATVSLGTTTVQHPGEANFTVAMQSITQANGTTVQTPFLPAEGGNPTSLVVTDLNGDGLPDFVVSYASTDSLGVFLNHGNGQFTPSKVDLGTISPTRIVAGEFSGSGHADIAIVSAAAITTAQTGLSSEVFIATNDGTGHLTVPTTAAVTLPGVATDAAGAQAYDTTTGAPVTNANLFIGFQNGTISPVFFQNGVPTVKASINAFVVNQVPVPAPVDSLDAEVSGGLYSVLAYSKDVNAAGTAAGNTTLGMLPQVDVFALDSTGQASAPLIITPDASVTKVHFVAGTNLVGAVEPGAVTIYNVVERNYVALDTLTSTGALSDFSVTNQNGTYQIAAVGAASNRFFFTTGDPGSTAGVTPFLASETPFEPRAINFTTGDGGNGGTLAGGAGGMIKGLTYTQTLGGGVLEAGGSYNTVLTTGHGGTSNGGGGGNGGGIQNVNLSLNPAYLTYSDDTTSAVFSTGAGGQGTTGGNGGSVSKVATTSVFSEPNGGDGIYLNSVAVNLETGAGGVGTAAAGGAGGSISLAGQAAFSGVTFVDSDSLSASNPGLLVKAGDGGNGVTAGGAGGSLTNVGSQNATQSGSVFTGNELASALLSSGSGGAASAGNGGAGGSITGSNVTTQEAGLAVVINNVSQPPVAKDGSVTVISGNGGVGHGGTGGDAGSINQSTVASVDGDPVSGYGVLVKGGVGGNGDTGGGKGGSLKQMTINGPADPTLYAAVVAAGNGGNALKDGFGGKGGGVKNLSQTKDVNSAINVIQAGNGGLGVGEAGGAGGAVKSINTVGFIGLPSTDTANLGAYYNLPTGSAGVEALFASSQVPQGIFAGQGGNGAANGSVENVVARQIAAIGASVEANGHFAVASKVDNITADLIGYQVDRSLTTFESAGGSGVSPAAAVPIDGFILAAAVSDINTKDNSRTALFTFNG